MHIKQKEITRRDVRNTSAKSIVNNQMLIKQEETTTQRLNHLGEEATRPTFQEIYNKMPTNAELKP